MDNLSISHIDTCLPCFLTDHHNRDGECLFGVYVDGSTSRLDLMNELIDEVRQTGDRLPESISDDAVKACIKSLFAEAYGTTEEAFALPFDPSLDIVNHENLADADAGGDEVPQAWFLLTWDVPDEETAD